MTNIDSDDPLADFLSDGSNDSFFEEPKMVAKRPSLVKPTDKKTIADLFGLDAEKTKETQNKEVDWLGLGEDKSNITEGRKGSIRQTPKITKKISFEEDNDILNSLGIEKNENVAKGGGESSKRNILMESLFGPTKPQVEDHSSIQDILKVSKSIKTKADDSIQQPVMQQSRRPSTPEGRRSRHQRPGSGILDPLGLFSNPSTAAIAETEPAKPIKPDPNQSLIINSSNEEVTFPIVKNRELLTRSAPNIKDLPEWLGEQQAVKAHKSDMDVTTNKIEPSNAATGPEDNEKVQSIIMQQQLATSHMEFQNTSIALQQQESQLLMALQLKKYEENMTDLQHKQQEVLMKQEQQFNNLLERQFAKQHVMENNMRLQQERINNHIQMLIAQPPVSGKIDTTNEQEEIYQLKKSNSEENSKLYEEMISTLKQRQQEEVFLLNESYRKQISLLENSMESIENRLKAEFENLSKQFDQTILNVRKEHEDDIDKYKLRFKEMSNSHTNEIKLLRENHNRIIEEIRFEYSTMVENMKQIKQTESSIADNAHSFSQKLDSNLEFLDVNSKILSEIRGKVDQEYGVLSLAREESLKAKEEEIRLMRVSLDKSRESAETERAQLMGLVRSLETKLVEQRQNSREEHWALQQAASVLTARSSAFDRETEFTRSSLEREREQLKTLKESLLHEQEKIMLQLTEEKLSLYAEKSRFETSAKLNQSYDAQKAHAEIDAAIRVTKEATELTDRERERLYQQQTEIESLKRNLLDRERKINLKEKELEGMQINSERKIQDGEKAITEARALETQYNARLRDIQGQLLSLTTREKRLAEDKIALSKERLALNTYLRQLKKCRLCTTENIRPEAASIQDVEQDFSPRILAVTDPELLKLRYEINEARVVNDMDEFEG